MIRYRVEPEDFKVEEIPLYPPTGEGGHTFVRILKRLRTSDAIARQIAEVAGVPARDVGYAGRKDRVAVTTQWMSVPGLAPDEALTLELDGAEVLEAIPHPHKLRTGQLKGNLFELLLRGVDETSEESARARLGEIEQRGMPNRFGAQRFGHGNRNPDKGRAILAGETSLRDRRKARFMISALQSQVFNRTLEERPLALDAVESGDVARVTESGGLFLVEDVQTDLERASRFEISATGPIFGTKMSEPSGEVALREARIMEEFGIPLGSALSVPRGLRVPGARRPVRVRVGDPVLSREGDDLRFCFGLPSGSYATVLLEELFPEIVEGRG
ncbi:MAG: tRNA pseudouridine(13) synthase TruD [Spirochaeta sp.]|nr:tRNA pseudouridine(13) synthase TruD [Spirochaeta sp.]